jgi:NADH-quinone oxidoreductase subunit N
MDGAMGGLSSLILNPLAPAASLVLAALVMLVVDWFVREDDARPPASLALIGLLASLLMVWRQWVASPAVSLPGASDAVSSAGGFASEALLSADAFGLFVEALLVVVSALVVLLSIEYAGRRNLARAEYFAIVLLATAGMMVLAIAGDLILIFLCLEVFSIALYLLSAFGRCDRRGHEAGLKYFVLGAVAAGFLLYGIALLYGATGSTNLETIGALVAEQAPRQPVMLYAGLTFILVGLGFKLAVVPFHQWTPDVYQGAPMTVTALMSAATKATALAVLLRVMWTAFSDVSPVWSLVVVVLAVLTMVVGNLAALVQSDVKRMLAYSAIAHTGYLLVAVVVGTPAALSAALYYLLIYAMMNVGAFGVLLGIGRLGPQGRDATTLDDLRGLGRRHLGLALAMSVFLFSLTGLPPLAGFLAKWYLFRATVDAGLAWLAVIIAIGSVVSAFYYLRPIAYMLMVPQQEEATIEVPTATAITVATTALVIGLALVLSGPLVEAAAKAGQVGVVRRPVPEPAQQGQPMFFSPPMFEKGRKTTP